MQEDLRKEKLDIKAQPLDSNLPVVAAAAGPTSAVNPVAATAAGEAFSLWRWLLTAALALFALNFYFICVFWWAALAQTFHIPATQMFTYVPLVIELTWLVVVALALIHSAFGSFIIVALALPVVHILTNRELGRFKWLWLIAVVSSLVVLCPVAAIAYSLLTAVKLVKPTMLALQRFPRYQNLVHPSLADYQIRLQQVSFIGEAVLAYLIATVGCVPISEAALPGMMAMTILIFFFPVAISADAFAKAAFNRDCFRMLQTPCGLEWRLMEITKLGKNVVQVDGNKKRKHRLIVPPDESAFAAKGTMSCEVGFDTKRLMPRFLRVDGRVIPLCFAGLIRWI